MKKAAALLLLGLFITASFVFMTAVLADTPADPPEFYFTRLLYSEGGVRGGFSVAAGVSRCPSRRPSNVLNSVERTFSLSRAGVGPRTIPAATASSWAVSTV